MNDCQVELTIKDMIAYVVLNNTASFNELNAAMSQELLSIANELMFREDVKVVVLGSRGPDFSIGLDLTDSQVDAEVDEAYTAVRLASEMIEKWARIPYPIIAAIDGRCMSLGFSLACVADVRYASSTAFFSIPEGKHGLVPAGGITQRLPRLIGKGPAISMLLGGEAMPVQEAERLGLVNGIAEGQSAWDAACEEAMQLSKLSTLSLQFTKECLLRGGELSFEQALRLELDVYMLLQTSDDRMEGVQAFLEKRAPQFTGN
ncbi:enoyl-CoA hydratase/isomerase family protein [Sporosarcina sp. 179-K 3D1 HS]|uniref:enoyl-CoA hydratase/isomerase family protein n=1 Tax=Sporosarcina sp. 179-K 3D1 HS TaxID=3232169 RepID=UPI0039A1B00E